MNKTFIGSVAIIAILIFALAKFNLFVAMPAESVVAVTEIIVAIILAATYWVEAYDFLFKGEHDTQSCLIT